LFKLVREKLARLTSVKRDCMLKVMRSVKRKREPVVAYRQAGVTDFVVVKSRPNPEAQGGWQCRERFG
jgi:hypothetical protein